MYPVLPVGVLDDTLVRTGFPVATLLWVATVLLIAGLLLIRASKRLAGAEPEA